MLPVHLITRSSEAGETLHGMKDKVILPNDGFNMGPGFRRILMNELAQFSIEDVVSKNRIQLLEESIKQSEGPENVAGAFVQNPVLIRKEDGH